MLHQSWAIINFGWVLYVTILDLLDWFAVLTEQSKLTRNGQKTTKKQPRFHLVPLQTPFFKREASPWLLHLFELWCPSLIGDCTLIWIYLITLNWHKMIILKVSLSFVVFVHFLYYKFLLNFGIQRSSSPF